EAMAASHAVSLLCLPHAGAGASFYLRLQRFLPSFVEVIPVDLPGHGRWRDEPLETTMEGVIAAVRARVSPSPQRPYALFGHSLGALAAFEYAYREETEHKSSPLVVFASSSQAPSVRREHAESGLADEDLLSQMRKLAGTPATALQSRELMELILPLLRADLQVARGYSRGTEHRVRCPIHVLAGVEDSLEESALCAWRDHTRSEFRLTYLPGNHFYIEQCLPRLGSLLASRLAQRLRGATPAQVAAG
ncbi:MAG TPA: alpha/beta fold hydrolase, partial [Polyangiales bacterium]|nr:alpha/beta fold hydrolase [Polyangiales bacterium]